MPNDLCIAWIGLGSNLGDRKQTLMGCYSSLRSLSDRPLRLSPLYETPAWGYLNQPPFINQVIALTPSLPPEELLCSLLEIERHFNRTRSIRWGPRTLDLDLLDCSGIPWSSETLTLPHPRLHLRRFVLQPWSDLAPEYYLPHYSLTVQELLQCCPDPSNVTRLSL